jgi:hypothetical protein
LPECGDNVKLPNKSDLIGVLQSVCQSEAKAMPVMSDNKFSGLAVLYGRFSGCMTQYGAHGFCL